MRRKYFRSRKKELVCAIKLCCIQFKTFLSRRLIFNLGHLTFKRPQVFWLLQCPVVGHSILGWYAGKRSFTVIRWCRYNLIGSTMCIPSFLLGGTSLSVLLIATISLDNLFSTVLHSSMLSMVSTLVMLWCLLQRNQAPPPSLNHFQTMYVSFEIRIPYGAGIFHYGSY